MEDLLSSSCHHYSLDEIKEATNNFDENKVIGHGGEGKVYLGEIYLGSENEKSRVAVKHLKTNYNFEEGIQTFSKIQHPHIVSLLGYCEESNQKILIYEFMEKGSLSDYIKSNSGSICLSWKQRLKICLGAARGLQHLHKETDECPKGIIHRDVKPHNILLSEKWVAKVSDFGLSKSSVAGQTKSSMNTKLKGTRGYYAPEYVRHLQITRKIDVYAFGVVLFEVLCRKNPWERDGESYYISENDDLGLWARQNVDTKIKTGISSHSLKAFTDIIRRSLQVNPERRPTMDGVIRALMTALKCQEREDERNRNIRHMATREREGKRHMTLNGRPLEIDLSELESLFLTTSALDGPRKGGSRHGSKGYESTNVHLVDSERANNCEIMLGRMMMPVAYISRAILAWDASAFEIDQVVNLILFCPTKEEMELLQCYKGDKEMLGKCEQFFMELMKVPRVKSKLIVLYFKIKFSSQVNDLRHNLTTINNAATEIKESTKLHQILQTILTLGNALDKGTARVPLPIGSALGFRLETLIKLCETRARDTKMTLMHYLCKLLAEKMPELLDFDEDLIHLDAASSVQLKLLAEDMQAVGRSLKKVEPELTASENDGSIFASFQEVFKSFFDTAEAEVKSLKSLYSEVVTNADSLAVYFGVDPTQTSFEQVTYTLALFVEMFKKARDENEQQVIGDGSFK